MKAFTARGFSVNKKYERIADLILAYVWNLGEPREAVTYALDYPQAVAVADSMEWTKTASWLAGEYTTTNPSKRLVSLLEPYQMAPSRWRALIAGRMVGGS